QLDRRTGVVDDHRHAVESADRRVGLDPIGNPWRPVIAIGRQQLEHQPGTIRKADRRFPEAWLDVVDREAALAKMCSPKPQRADRNGERRDGYLPCALRTDWNA